MSIVKVSCLKFDMGSYIFKSSLPFERRNILSLFSFAHVFCVQYIYQVCLSLRS